MPVTLPLRATSWLRSKLPKPWCADATPAKVAAIAAARKVLPRRRCISVPSASAALIGAINPEFVGDFNNGSAFTSAGTASGQRRRRPSPQRLATTASHTYDEHAYHLRDSPIVTTRFDDRALGFLINDVARLVRRNFNRRVQSLGLTQAQWRAIAHLSRSEGMTQVALADSLEIQPITLTRLIDRMEAAGWVERRNHPLDRRAVQLFLKPKAQPVLEEMHGFASETLAEAVAGMSAADQRRSDRRPRAREAKSPDRRGRGRGDRTHRKDATRMSGENPASSTAPASAHRRPRPRRAAASGYAACC